ncbi:MAG: SDR family oxidoreductase [Chloroflexota bacterium]
MKTLDQLLNHSAFSGVSLRGQVALVTGAGRGIGRETARALARLGARLVIAELDLVSGDETASLIRRAGGEAIFVPTDVSNPDAVAALAARTHAAFGVLDILVNNAILCPVAPLVEMELGLWDRVIAVNLRAAFLTCKTFLPEMLARNRGVIVNMISSDAMPGLAAYIASKQGLNGFSQSLALEVGGQGVRVIPFGPGMVDTPGIRAAAPALAPCLGMSEAQLLSVPLHPAFDGLMPVEYAAAAAAYLIAVLADEYHGDPVNGYTVLERAGIIPAAAPPPGDAPAPAESFAPPAADLPGLLDALFQVLLETEAEFASLPVFARPLARSGFKSKAGASLTDWQRLIDSTRAGVSPAADLPARLNKLAAYYRGVPAETARFTRDRELLRSVEQLCCRRVELIESLAHSLVKSTSPDSTA